MKIYKVGGLRVRMKSPQEKNHVIGTVSTAISTVKDVANIKQTLGVTTDNVLIRTRDKILDYFRKYKLNFEPAIKRHRLAHADIPDRKVGADYSPEFKRLWEFVISVFQDNGRGDAATIFQKMVPVFTPEQHDPEPVELILSGRLLLPQEPVTVKDVASAIANEQISKTQLLSEVEKAVLSGNSQNDNLKVLAPFEGLMKSGLREAGYVPSGSLEDIALMFYEKIVKPASGSHYENDCVDNAIVSSILHFIATVQQQKEQGKELPKAYDKIAELATQLQERSGVVAMDIAKQKTGEFVFDNKALIIGGAAFLVVVLLILISKK